MKLHCHDYGSMSAKYVDDLVPHLLTTTDYYCPLLLTNEREGKEKKKNKKIKTHSFKHSSGCKKRPFFERPRINWYLCSINNSPTRKRKRWKEKKKERKRKKGTIGEFLKHFFSQKRDSNRRASIGDWSDRLMFHDSNLLLVTYDG